MLHFSARSVQFLGAPGLIANPAEDEKVFAGVFLSGECKATPVPSGRAGSASRTGSVVRAARSKLAEQAAQAARSGQPGSAAARVAGKLRLLRSRLLAGELSFPLLGSAVPSRGGISLPLPQQWCFSGRVWFPRNDAESCTSPCPLHTVLERWELYGSSLVARQAHCPWAFLFMQLCKHCWCFPLGTLPCCSSEAFGWDEVPVWRPLGHLQAACWTH